MALIPKGVAGGCHRWRAEAEGEEEGLNSGEELYHTPRSRVGVPMLGCWSQLHPATACPPARDLGRIWLRAFYYPLR